MAEKSTVNAEADSDPLAGVLEAVLVDDDALVVDDSAADEFEPEPHAASAIMATTDNAPARRADFPVRQKR